ncbi:MAG: bacteriophage abortive infection AbiH family protein [Colwellia sp.]|nr:bacteriophage abortive infection AbiH family protein [Colwellia sp.]MCW9082265.1 bacteriophage abortive infection AbiH family protein [Colwellia sp.]
MSKLYIIGNGFDLHHGLSTSYTDFEHHLKTHHIQLLDSLNKYYFIEGIDQKLWSKFEENLANIDKDGLVDYLLEYYDDTSDRGRNAMGIETDTYLDLLTNDLRREFSEFILKAEAKGIDRSKLIQIGIDAKFISFNYSKTLEKEYLIPNENIFYIHGIASEKEGITLGHSTDPELFIDEKIEATPPKDASEETLEQWTEYMSDQHNPIYDNCVSTVNSYFLNSFKNTNSIIKENSDYFSDLSDIKEVFIFGHSMSDVDMEYIENIASTVKSDCHWCVSYYDQNEKEEIEFTLEHLNISSEFYQLIKLTDLQHLYTTD